MSLIRYSTYQTRDSSFKTPIWATTTKLNTADGSPMTALGKTTLHLRIMDFKFTQNCILCDRTTRHRDTIWNLYPEKKIPYHMPGIREKNCYIQRDGSVSNLY